MSKYYFFPEKIFSVLPIQSFNPSVIPSSIPQNLTIEAPAAHAFGVAHFKAGPDRQLFVAPNLGSGSFNHLSQAGDLGVIFSDGLASGNQNQSAGLVLAPWTGGWARGIRIDADGKVGIGTATPQAELDVEGDVHIEGPVGIGVTQPEGVIHIEGDLIIRDPASGENEIHLTEVGNIICRQLDVSPMPIPDYVFEKDYPLMPLSMLQEYIQENQHLPGIKSAKEYEEIGRINVGELSIKLLEKVEELSLYIIELEKKIEQLQNKSQTNTK